MLKFYDDIIKIPKIGQKKKELYKKLQIFKVCDLLYHLPRDYFNLTPTEDYEIKENQKAVIKATVLKKSSEQRIRKGLSVFKVLCDGETKRLNITFFNAKYSVLALEYDKQYLFFGEVTKNTLTTVEMTSPLIFSIDYEKTLYPVYSATMGLSSKIIANDIKRALPYVVDFKDCLPNCTLEENSLLDLKTALYAIHNPKNIIDAQKGLHRIIFEELFVFSLNMMSIKENRLKKEVVPWKIKRIDDFLKSLPFKPTNAQIRVISEISKDLTSKKLMNRMVEGDVGSGKTLIAAAAAFLAFKNGFQTAVMVPTETLAQQHLKSFTRLFLPFGIKCCIVLGSQTVKERREALEGLAQGKYHVAVGTHALFSDSTKFKSLRLCITDEQHRFGVEQRKMLGQKGKDCHTLVMSATPIPRTLSLIIYGDLDLSIIDELPSGRTPVKTYLVGYDKHIRALNFIKGFVQNKKQAYIVCPIIEESENINCLSATELYEELKAGIFKGISVGLLNGKQKPKEKEYIMEKFLKNEISVLVSTTVIEVGIDVPNSVVILIENAERFGLSQLHQLRGRVGRGKDVSYCILMSNSKSEETNKRLRTLCSSTDGFFIARQDLKLRGPGDMLGFRQHGVPLFKNADLVKDENILLKAQYAASNIAKEDNWRQKYPSLAEKCDEFIKLIGYNLN